MNIEDIDRIAESLKSGRPRGDNSYNVSWAAVAVSAYNKVVVGDVVGITISDLLGDLMHLADAAGVDFEEALYTARFNYSAEIGGEVIKWTEYEA